MTPIINAIDVGHHLKSVGNGQLPANEFADPATLRRLAGLSMVVVQSGWCCHEDLSKDGVAGRGDTSLSGAGSDRAAYFALEGAKQCHDHGLAYGDGIHALTGRLHHCRCQSQL